jgi:hypothetical protein
MSDESGAFVRGFGDLASGKGAIAWGLAGGGAVTLEGGKATASAVESVSAEPGGGWSFQTSVDGDSLEGAATFRHVAVETAEGTIVCTAIGPPGIAGHGDERTAGSLRAGDEEVPYDETLISTQYDESGDPTRFGLELWPPDADQTTRAAATRVSASLIGGARSGEAWAGLFRCHADGHEGLGSYLLWRA